MAEDAILSDLLINVSRYPYDYDIAIAQNKMLHSISFDWSATYCAVYIKKTGSYELFQEYNPSGTGIVSFHLENLDLNDAPAYVNERGQIQCIFPESPVQRYLYLPILREKSVYGFLLALWDKPSPFDQCSNKELGLLMPLSLVLKEIYVEPVLAQTLHENEIKTDNLFLTAQQKLDEYMTKASLALHDEIDRTLTSIVLQLESLQCLDDIDIILGRLKGLQIIAEQSLEKVQQVYVGMNPHLLSRVGLEAALTALIREYSDSPDIEVALSVAGEAQNISPTAETIIYQAAGQVLSSLRQQSYQGQASVRLTVKKHCAFLQVTCEAHPILREIAEQKLTGLHKQVNAVSGKLWFNYQDALEASINLLLP